MPFLTEEDQARLLGPQTWTCSVCKKPVSRGYCRACDEFYFTCDCPKDEEERHQGPHCRTY